MAFIKYKPHRGKYRGLFWLFSEFPSPFKCGEAQGCGVGPNLKRSQKKDREARAIEISNGKVGVAKQKLVFSTTLIPPVADLSPTVSLEDKANALFLSGTDSITVGEHI